MKKDSVIIKKSKIHNRGVFASRDFKKGETVIHWDISKTISREEIDKLTDKEKLHICFSDGKYIIAQEPECLVNHSCDPNVFTKDFCELAIRDISRGEEITANYSNDIPLNIKMKCNCGSNNCKKIIQRSAS